MELWAMKVKLFVNIVLLLVFPSAAQSQSRTSHRPANEPGDIAAPLWRTYTIGPVAIDITSNILKMTLTNSVKPSTLTSKIGINISNPLPYVVSNTQRDIHLRIPDRADLRIKNYKYQYSDCADVSWRVTGCISEVLTDCVDLGTSHWFGGAELMLQLWPLEKIQSSLKPFISSDMFGNDKYGPVQERLFFNSDGFGIYIEEDIPLFVSVNESGSRSLCLQSKCDGLWYSCLDGSLPELNYTVCTSSDVKSIQQVMMHKYIKKPTGTPNQNLFRYPIWSTWAQYKVNINQSLVVDFVKNIKKYNFSISQVEIDDVWTPKYGDLDFDRTTFPDPKGMVEYMHRENIPVTLWVHPFINMDSKAFPYLASQGWMMLDLSGERPALTSWWNGKLAGHVDFSNPSAAQWFLSELTNLQTAYGIDSFKIDAGDASYLPPLFRANQSFVNPEHYTRLYSKTVVKSDKYRRMEVRTGVRTQDLPVMVRVLDRDSAWGLQQGLRSVITSCLLFGILGYPFVLPDYVGGNSYDSHPDPELFIRWTQANALMPVMQFSLLPWAGNNSTVLEVAQDMVKLHEKYADLFISLANESVTTGYPIMRPLWWIAPTDEAALTVDDQFLVGDDLLVAPVVEKGEIIRRIYLPSGRWRDELKGKVIDGGKWIDYPVTLRDLPYFSKIVK